MSDERNIKYVPWQYELCSLESELIWRSAALHTGLYITKKYQMDGMFDDVKIIQ